MKRWLLLMGAIIAEVFGTVSLRAAVDHPVWSIGVIVGYLIAFMLLGLALGQGIPIGVAYGVWAAAGVALVALLGAIIFGETLSVTAIVGIVTIIAGVYIVQTGEDDPQKAEVLQP
ncbi:MAG TPA: QacE family quaternary ammonium compound efflux SMR transporter [Candidatus Yaniella excrementigallinarum]|nr:QacE family quaternary ammonium compound efflux SMR transporter [Candidatus Yaniella excrementigallinarum]